MRIESDIARNLFRLEPMAASGSAERRKFMAKSWPKLALAVLTWSALAGTLGASAAGAKDPASRETPSGLPVPRYVSLKFDSVNARSGPGDDHRLLWVFHAKGLPVQVVAETAEWRRVCDPDRTLSWVHKRTTDGARTVMRTDAGPIPIRHGPRPSARIDAYLASKAPAAMDHCDKGWCKVRVGRTSGWIEAGAVWGTNDAAQCR
jgi:SH3-like domain-containing protein